MSLITVFEGAIYHIKTFIRCEFVSSIQYKSPTFLIQVQFLQIDHPVLTERLKSATFKQQTASSCF